MAIETKSKNILLNFIIIVVALVIAFNFIYKKQEQELQNLMAQKEAELKKNAVLENIVRLEGNIDNYKNLLPQKDVSQTITSINDLAREAKVKIVSIKPLPADQVSTAYAKSSFDVSVSAPTYHVLGKFISSLESYQDVFIVEFVDISSQEQGKELTANMKVSTITVIE
jgi:Tfp pilus assembly protein PilO